MNKADFVTTISRKTKYTKKEINELVNLFLDTIVEGVKKDEKVVFCGFGTFEKRERKARKGRNIQTGEELHIPACVIPYFSAGASFKKEIVKND